MGHETQISYEASKVTPPLKNSNAMKCIAVLVASPTSQSVDLTTLFAGLDAGHFLSAQADGGKIYIAFGASAGSIDESAQGNGPNVCWPLVADIEKPVWPINGRESATGISTTVTYNFLHFKTSSGVGTAYLRLYRSSSNEQGSFNFKAP